jgi:hypothetical protein
LLMPTQSCTTRIEHVKTHLKNFSCCTEGKFSFCHVELLQEDTRKYERHLRNEHGVFHNRLTKHRLAKIVFLINGLIESSISQLWDTTWNKTDQLNTCWACEHPSILLFLSVLIEIYWKYCFFSQAMAGCANSCQSNAK